MTKTCFASALAVIAFWAGAALVFPAPGFADGQAQPAAAKTWNPPRTPDGQPDIQGFWDTQEYVGSVETGLRNPVSAKIQGQNIGSPAVVASGKAVSNIVDPPDGKIPYQPWAEARRQEIASRYGPGTPLSARDLGPEIICTIGLPRIVYFVEFQVVQTPGYVVMSFERTHSYRVIPLNEDGRPRLAPSVKLHMGDARGHWEGNTLVVNTTNLNDWGWFDSKGTIHTDATSLVERYTFTDANTMRYQVTVTDPKAFTRPWTIGFTFKREHAQEEGYELMENACVEGERALVPLLGGERQR